MPTNTTTTEEKQVNPRTIMTESTVAKATKEDKLKLTRQYKKTTCSECDHAAIYMPQHQKVICPQCLKIPLLDAGLNMDEIQPYDFLTKEAKDKLESIETSKSRYRVVYPSPEYYADKDLPGRNEKCVCGSGKKYKKCCMDKIMSARNRTVDDSIKRNKEATVVATANTVKLYNSIARQFADNPELIELPMDEVEFTPFININGKLATREEPDPDIKEAIPVEDTKEEAACQTSED